MANQCLCWVTVRSVQMPWGRGATRARPQPDCSDSLPTLWLPLCFRSGKDRQVETAEWTHLWENRRNENRKLKSGRSRASREDICLHKPKVEIRLIDFRQSSGVDVKKLLARSVWNDLYLTVTAAHYDWQSPSTQFTPTRHCPPSSPRCSWPLYKSPPNFTHLLPVSICQAHSPVQPVMKNSHYSPPPNRYASR